MPRTRFSVTGFGPFLPDAPHNPTQALVERLDGMKAENATEVMADAAGASGAESTTTPLFALVDCRVVDVETESAIAAVNALAACIESTPCEDGDDACRVLVHLGVYNSLNGFRLERCAVNEATFRIPDVKGRRCDKEVICAEEGGLEKTLTTILPLEAIASELEEKGFPCSVSDDAGKFLCNFLYFHSLRLSAAVTEGGKQGKGKTTSLFVHVPPFSTIAQPQQEKFLANLLRTIATHTHNMCADTTTTGTRTTSASTAPLEAGPEGQPQHNGTE